MIERKFWQVKWQNIEFKDANLPTSYSNIADKLFYAKFYSHLFNKYNSLDSLPCEWKENKTETAKNIMKIIENKTKVLSFGSGLGFVENYILNNKDIFLDLFEINEKPLTLFLRNRKSRVFNNIYDLDKYDYIYLQQVIYALPKDVLIETLRLLSNKLNNNGKIILIDTSANLKENHKTKVSFMKTILYQFKLFFRPIYYLIFYFNSVQFWGWERDDECVINYLKKSNLKLIRKYAAANQSFKIFARAVPEKDVQ